MGRTIVSIARGVAIGCAVLLGFGVFAVNGTAAASGGAGTQPTLPASLPSGWFLAKGAPGLQAVEPTPGRRTGRLDIFARGVDNALWQIWFDPETGLARWRSLDGLLSSAPDATSWGPGRMDVVARGLDNAIWWRSYANGAWGEWVSLGGNAISAPTIVSWGPGRLDTFHVSTDNGLWQKTYANGAWGTNWVSLGGHPGYFPGSGGAGGELTSAPDAASPGAGFFSVFARGPDGDILHLQYNGNVNPPYWSTWQNWGGNATSDPGATASEVGVLDVFARGPDNAIWRKSIVGGEIQRWTSLGGQLTSGPDACQYSAATFALFARGTDSSLYYYNSDGQGNSFWTSFGGVLTSDPAVVC